jgi:GNAT superfamily N-acetyltransferase
MNNKIKFEVSPFPKDSAKTEYEALNNLLNSLRKERLPDDPPLPVEETISNLQTIPPFVDLQIWVVRLPGQNDIIAMGDSVIMQTPENQHLQQFEISVEAGYRRQGIGTHMLGLVAAEANKKNRRLLMTNTSDRIPGGDAFMKSIGAQAGMQAHTNQLALQDLNPDLVTDWLERSKKNSLEFELGLWMGPYPEAQLEDIARLSDIANQQPIGDLDIEDMHTSPEQLREMENNLFSRGGQRWTFFIRERSGGKFAGFTETIWNPNRPEVVRQELTGVFPEFRNKGFGRWLKAAMLEKILSERPQVKFIRTGNADSNVAMLKINNELGFKPYSADTIWQVELHQVESYLSSANSPATHKDN